MEKILNNSETFTSKLQQLRALGSKWELTSKNINWHEILKTELGEI